jgi:hypothetical protein
MHRLAQLANRIWLHKEDITAAVWMGAIPYVYSVFKQMSLSNYRGPRL